MMIDNQIRDLKYSLENRQEIFRQDLIKKLNLYNSLPFLNGQILSTLKSIRKVVPIEDRKVVKLFNAVLNTHGISDSIIHPYAIPAFHQEKNMRYLSDHHLPPFLIPTTHLSLDFQDNDCLIVKATLTVKKNHRQSNKKLVLHGEGLNPTSVTLNGKELMNGQDNIIIKSNRIEIPANLLSEDDAFIIKTSTLHELTDPPSAFTGIFRQGDWISSLCEPAEFKRITYFIDRPDNPTRFSVEATLNKFRYPQFLTNGVLVEKRDVGNDRYQMRYEMNYPIPSYLFGCAAGNYVCLKDECITKSARKICLEVYCQHGNEKQTAWILDTAKSALHWFEEKFSLDFKQDALKFVCVDSKNYNGMENEGIIFLNTDHVTKRNLTADSLYSATRTLVHEIFHHRTGNSPTIPSMFYRAFKEGLTRYLDAKFMSENISARMTILHRSKVLNIFHLPSFAERRPQRVMPLVPLQTNAKYNYDLYNECYSLGKEIFNMLELALGEENLLEGVRRFLIRYENKAAAYDELFHILSELIAELNLPAFNFEQFSRWLYEIDIPTVHTSMKYVEAERRAIIHVTQYISDDKPFVIPLVIGFLNQKGQEIMPSETRIITKRTEKLVFENINEPPIPSLFRKISAPVKWQFQGYDMHSLRMLMNKDTDDFNRYRACRQFWNEAISLGGLTIKSLLNRQPTPAAEFFFETLKSLILNENLPIYLKAEMLESCFCEGFESITGVDLMIIFAFYNREIFFDILKLPTSQNTTTEEENGLAKLKIFSYKILQIVSIKTNYSFLIPAELTKKLAEESPFMEGKSYYQSQI